MTRDQSARVADARRAMERESMDSGELMRRFGLARSTAKRLMKERPMKGVTTSMQKRERKPKMKNLCESCGKSYKDIRAHLKGNAHRRRATQQAMGFAKAAG